MGSPHLGNLSASYTNQLQHNGEERRLASVFLSRRIGKSASVVARYIGTLSGARDHEAFIGLTWSMDGGRFGGLEFQRSRDMDRLSGRFARNSPLGPGFGYSVRSGLADGDSEADIALEYAARTATYALRYFRNDDLRSLRLGSRGSVSWIGGGLHLARPITDSFTLVDANELAGVDVYLNHQPMGKTNSDGQLLIPRLTPYYGNRLSFDDRSIPLNYEIPALEQVSATPFRGGGITRFDVRLIQGITGRIFVEMHGETNPAEYWGLRYQDTDVMLETVVGVAGEFYLENLSAGDVQAEIFRGEQTCRLTLVVPQSRAMFIDLGDIACAISD
jgi:outer membrane usher protein